MVHESTIKQVLRHYDVEQTPFFHLLKSKVFNMEYFITNHISCNNHNLKLYKYEQQGKL